MAQALSVVLTGHWGYIGSHILAELRRVGHDIRTIETGLFPIPSELPDPHVVNIRRDIRLLDVPDFAGVDAVIHAAGIGSHALANQFPKATEQINTEAAIRLAQEARQAGVKRFIFLSTASLYEGSPEGWQDEESPTTPRSIYAHSKQVAEEALLGLGTDTFKPTIFRLPTLFGDSRNLRLDLIINTLVYRAVRGQHLEIHGTGLQSRPFAHVADVARILVAALDIPHDEAPLGPINLCREASNFTVREIIHTVAQQFPGVEVRDNVPSELAAFSYRVRSKRFSRWFSEELFTRDLAFGIRELKERFLSRPLSPEDEVKGVRAAWVAQRVVRGEFDEDLYRRPGQ